MLKIENLHAELANSNYNESPPMILNGINLQVNPGETHAIMGQNGSGKSTLSKVIARHPDYNVASGDIIFKNESLLDMSADEIAKLGMFLGFQYPVSIFGVNNLNFIKTIVNGKRAHNNLPAKDVIELLNEVKEKMKLLDMPEELLKRELNAGFSGGEKKRNEILQLLMLNPSLAILDEIDSGLDIDALNSVSNGINHFKDENKAVIMITHYQRLLNYVKPDYVHVMHKGKIIASDDVSLAYKLEEHGYSWIIGDSK